MLPGDMPECLCKGLDVGGSTSFYEIAYLSEHVCVCVCVYVCVSWCLCGFSFTLFLLPVLCSLPTILYVLGSHSQPKSSPRLTGDYISLFISSIFLTLPVKVGSPFKISPYFSGNWNPEKGENTQSYTAGQ